MKNQNNERKRQLECLRKIKRNVQELKKKIGGEKRKETVKAKSCLVKQKSFECKETLVLGPECIQDLSIQTQLGGVM